MEGDYALLRTQQKSQAMSVLGTERTFGERAGMSAFPKRTWNPRLIWRKALARKAAYGPLGLVMQSSPSPPTRAALTDEDLPPGSLWMRSADAINIPRCVAYLGSTFQ